MNRLLFISSSICIIWNFPYLFVSQQTTFVKLVYIAKHFTSILNYATGNHTLLLLDNSVTVLCACVDTVHINDLGELYLLMVYIIYYILSNDNDFTLFAQVSSNCLHNIILSN